MNVHLKFFHHLSKITFFIVFLSMISCGESREERAKKCDCTQASFKHWYDQGGTMGLIAKIADDGQRDYSWAKNAAIEGGSDLIGFPADEEKFGDCWYKGFLDSYDKTEK
jgi:hypothetical protein